MREVMPKGDVSVGGSRIVLEIPPLPEIAGATGLGGGMMFLTVNPFIIEGGAFDFDNFTYDDLAQYRWKSWGIRTITFTR